MRRTREEWVETIAACTARCAPFPPEVERPVTSWRPQGRGTRERGCYLPRETVERTLAQRLGRDWRAEAQWLGVAHHGRELPRTDGTDAHEAANVVIHPIVLSSTSTTAPTAVP
jgi:hypothetical protein